MQGHTGKKKRTLNSELREEVREYPVAHVIQMSTGLPRLKIRAGGRERERGSLPNTVLLRNECL